MSSLGGYLRELRRRRGVSLDEMARATRVNSQYLEALERDDTSVLPAPVFAKGFIRAYCQFLGEPPDEALALFAGRDGAPVVATPPPAAGAPASPTEREARSRGTVMVSFVLLVVLGLALFAVTLMLQSGRGERRLAGAAGEAGSAPAAVPSSPPPSAPSPTPAPAPRLPPPVVPTPAVPMVGAVTAQYRLVARVTEPTWLRVRTEEGRTTEETIPAGQSREWSSNAPFVLTVGNAGGVTLELNGRTLPPLGTSGAVIPRLVIPSPQQ